MGEEYEADEIVQALLSIDGQLFSYNGNDYLSELTGDSPTSTGIQDLTLTLSGLSVGTHSLTFGVFNNQKTYNDESSSLTINYINIGQICPACDANQVGMPCDDVNECTINDIYDENCFCTGTLIDDNNNNICDIDECIDIELYAYLEGTFDTTTGEMTTMLNTQRGMLPGQTPVSALATPTVAGQPYSIAPWNYQGAEGQDWTDADYTGIEVDWIMVSFRTDIASNTEIARTAAILNKDGSVNFIDRCVLSPPLSSTYIVLEHRNHMGVMTPQAIGVNNGYLFYDFRIGDSYRDATSFGQKLMFNGTWCLYAGDSNQNDVPSFDINGTDKSIWFDNNGIFDNYISPDFNLDGDVNGQDKAIWEGNNGISSRVPK